MGFIDFSSIPVDVDLGDSELLYYYSTRIIESNRVELITFTSDLSCKKASAGDFPNGGLFLTTSTNYRYSEEG